MAEPLDIQDRDDTVLPCGCIATTGTVSGVPTFVFTPCHLDCKNHLYVQQEAARQNKPLDYRMAP